MAMEPITNATKNETCRLAITLPPRTPPKICVMRKSGNADSNSATTKKSRPNKFPNIICALDNGVVNKISHVLGLLSWAMAPAMNTGVNKQMAITCPKLISVNALAPRCAKSFILPVDGPSNEKKTSTINIPKYKERISKCRPRILPPFTMRSATALLGPRARSQFRNRGMRTV